MDVLSSPYGVGAVPEPAMAAEVERRTQDLLRSSSFQQMLELEKKHKVCALSLAHRLLVVVVLSNRVLIATCLTPRGMPVSDIVLVFQQLERLRGVQPLFFPPTHPSAPVKEGPPPPRPIRPDAHFQQDARLMLKVARRNVTVPSLSIAIPGPAADEKRAMPNAGDVDGQGDEHAGNGAPTNHEPSQKHVKFLAPEGNAEGMVEDDADDVSEQSSICQSPSWEGYGQRKKEKKLEAERRKREKEQAEKEARAARKRNAARLSKPPPPSASASRSSKAVGMPGADRSMSDPMLISRHLGQSGESMQRPEDADKAASSDDLRQRRRYRPAVSEMLLRPGSDAKRVVSSAVQDPQSSEFPRNLPYGNAFALRQDVRRSASEEPTRRNRQPSPASAPKHEGRPARDACPPSASRTPLLRYLSPSANNRSSGLLKGTASLNRSADSLPAVSAVDGSGRDGYVRRQRAQAAERAMASLADEQLVCSAVALDDSPASNPVQTRHSRRPSLTQEAKSAAMRFMGIRSSSAAASDEGSRSDNPGSQCDSLASKAVPYSVSGDGTSASPEQIDRTHEIRADEPPSAPESCGLHNAVGSEERLAAVEGPRTSRSSFSSSGPSTAGSVPSDRSKKSRSLKDAAKAAFSMSKSSPNPRHDSEPPVPVPPHFAARSGMHSRASAHQDSGTSQTLTEVGQSAPSVFDTSLPCHSVPKRDMFGGTDALQTATATIHPGGSQPKPAEMQPQGGFRASEGSSSSSACEDCSPLPSPATTPDTSRPQSAKDAPLAARELNKESSRSFGVQDDERTIRQPPGSSRSSTPRVGDSQERGSTGFENEDDRCGKTTLPYEVDCDVQSLMASYPYLGRVDDAEWPLSNAVSPPHAEQEQRNPIPPESGSLAVEQPKVSRPSFSPDARASSTDHYISIPPRSKKRELVGADRSKGDSNSTSLSAERHEENSSAHRTRMPREVGKMATRPAGSASENGETVESRELSKRLATPEREMKRGNPEKRKREDQHKHQQKEGQPRGDPETGMRPERGREEEDMRPAAFDRSSTPRAESSSLNPDWRPAAASRASSTVPSVASTSPPGNTAPASDYQIPGNPYFADLPGPPKDQGHAADILIPSETPSPISLPSPLHHVVSRPPPQGRMHSSPAQLSAAAAAPTSRASSPSSGRSSGMLRQQPRGSTSELAAPAAAHPSAPRAHVLSALPKHMQLQAGASMRHSTGGGGGGAADAARQAPIAKMLVECCSCRFFHDMPSKVYECMARPDAVVEDRALGISGAITTMVKCPWCQHNMSRTCCAGYAALVHLRERLH